MELEILQAEDIKKFKLDMQESFQMGAIEGNYPLQEGEIILPESHIERSLQQKQAIAYKVVHNGVMVGGAIVVLDRSKHMGNLDFLYVKHGCQGQGIGKFIWFAIERLHPDITIWETCTPYFEKRNIHFYINVCGFCACEFFHAGHKYPHSDILDDGYAEDEPEFEMFSFRKVKSEGTIIKV